MSAPAWRTAEAVERACAISSRSVSKEHGTRTQCSRRRSHSPTKSSSQYPPMNIASYDRSIGMTSIDSHGGIPRFVAITRPYRCAFSRVLASPGDSATVSRAQLAASIAWTTSAREWRSAAINRTWTVSVMSMVPMANVRGRSRRCLARADMAESRESRRVPDPTVALAILVCVQLACVEQFPACRASIVVAATAVHLDHVVSEARTEAAPAPFAATAAPAESARDAVRLGAGQHDGLVERCGPTAACQVSEHVARSRRPLCDEAVEREPAGNEALGLREASARLEPIDDNEAAPRRFAPVLTAVGANEERRIGREDEARLQDVRSRLTTRDVDESGLIELVGKNHVVIHRRHDARHDIGEALKKAGGP